MDESFEGLQIKNMVSSLKSGEQSLPGEESIMDVTFHFGHCLCRIDRILHHSKVFNKNRDSFLKIEQGQIRMNDADAAQLLRQLI